MYWKHNDPKESVRCKGKKEHEARFTSGTLMLNWLNQLPSNGVLAIKSCNVDSFICLHPCTIPRFTPGCIWTFTTSVNTSFDKNANDSTIEAVLLEKSILEFQENTNSRYATFSSTKNVCLTYFTFRDTLGDAIYSLSFIQVEHWKIIVSANAIKLWKYIVYSMLFWYNNLTYQSERLAPSYNFLTKSIHSNETKCHFYCN